MLIKMANTLLLMDLAKIKKEWIETLMHVIMPMFEDSYLSDVGGAQTFFMFELTEK